MSIPRRKSIPVDARIVVLHEAGYRCANPICRTIITLDIHHLEQVSEGGSNEPSNLLPVCPNCHALHHRGDITRESLRAWKHLLLALNNAFDSKLVDLLLTLHKVGVIWVSGDGVLQCAPGIAAGLIRVESKVVADNYCVCLSSKGREFVDSWLAGSEAAAIGAA